MDHAPGIPAPTGGEHRDEQAAEPVAQVVTQHEVESTGVESVDRVLAEVAALADAPVGEHVPVFERAHEQLRRALDATPGPADDRGQGA
jgi:hypothetical protein